MTGNSSTISCEAISLPGFGAVTQWTLRNANGLSAAIMSYGATLLSVRTPDRDGRFDEIVLSCRQLENHAAERLFLGPVVGRFANRISGATFAVGQDRFSLSANEGNNTLHGGPQGFDRRDWSGEAIETGFGPGLRLSLASHDGDQGFPGNLHAEIQYVLTDDGALITEFMATTDRPCPVSLTLHGYWNLAGMTARAGISGHQLQLMANQFLPVDDSGIPTGELRSVANSRFDFRTPQQLGERLKVSGRGEGRLQGFDNCWAIDGAGLRPAAMLHDPGSGRRMTIETDRPGIQVYTANHFDPEAARQIGEEFAPHCAIALETQAFPDSPNQPAFTDSILHPGQIWRSRTIYRFSAD